MHSVPTFVVTWADCLKIVTDYNSAEECVIANDKIICNDHVLCQINDNEQ